MNDTGSNGAGCFEIKIWMMMTMDAAKKFRFLSAGS